MKKISIIIIVFSLFINSLSNAGQRYIKVNKSKLRKMIFTLVEREIITYGLHITYKIKEGLKFFPLDRLQGINGILSSSVSKNKHLKYCFISRKFKILFSSRQFNSISKNYLKKSTNY